MNPKLAPFLSTAVLAALAAGPSAQCELEKLAALDAALFDQLGSALALSGATVLVGSPFDDDGGSGSGSVYVFESLPGGFVPTQKLVASDAAAGDQFGSAVALAGDTALVGAPFDDDAGASSGALYVFQRTPTGFIQSAKLTAADAASGDRFGSALALAGSRALVGAPFDDDLGLDSGSAYVFQLGPAGFAQAQKLLAQDGVAGDQLGTALALAGGVIALGAPFADPAGPSSGAAYVFRDSGLRFAQTDKLVAAAAGANDQLGTALVLGAALVLVGAPLDDDASPDAGAVYAFRDGPAGFAQAEKLLPAGASAFARLGSALAGDAARVLAGAPGDAASEGAAYVFEDVGAGFVQTLRLSASDASSGDALGRALALGGSLALVSAPLDDDGGTDAGLVLAFAPQGTPAAEVVRAGNPPNALAFEPGVTSAPIIGRVWDPRVGGLFPAPVLDVLVLSANMANMPTPDGTLLVELPDSGGFVFGAPGAAFALPVPARCALVGKKLFTQGASVAFGPLGFANLKLANALDLTIGSF